MAKERTVFHRAAAKMRADTQIMMDGVPPQSIWANWTSTATLAVADLLDLAEYFGPVNEAHDPDCHECSVAIRAEAIARAYLGEQP